MSTSTYWIGLSLVLVVVAARLVVDDGLVESELPEFMAK
jgi:hypothetical protein